MKVLKNLFLLIAAIFVLGCSNEPDYEAVGKAICDCMQPMLDLTNEITVISNEDGKELETKALLDELAQQNLVTEECIDAVKTKFPNINTDNEKANIAFESSCPEIAEFLDKAAE